VAHPDILIPPLDEVALIADLLIDGIVESS
jgi:hypothetical protein